MANQYPLPHYTSADLEKAALSRFRALLSFLPKDCKLHREVWGRSTVICIDCDDCPESLKIIKSQTFLLLLVAHYLGLANSVLFKTGKKVKGWTTMACKE